VNVPSLYFLVFALAAAALYNISLGATWRKLVLLSADLLFLLSFSREPLAFVPFAGFLVLGYSAIRLLEASRSEMSRTSVVLPFLLISGTLLSFMWLKKYSLFPHGLFLDFPYVTIGLSYVFFRVMHLVIDASQGQIQQRVAVVDYANYTLNFLTLVSGPIQRYEDYCRQQHEQPPINLAVIVNAIERVILGFFKVIVLSMLLIEQHKFATTTLSLDQPVPLRIISGIEVTLLYPIYLYANFSGYCDVVIAIGDLFRLRLPENFDQPFASENFIAFWARWHITLSTWLRTYVYSPLMMLMLRHVENPNADALFSAFALFVTFFLVGAWHGQTSEFLFFGLLQGGGVAGNKLYQIFMVAALGRKAYRELTGDALYTMFSRGITFVWFGFTLLWFWSDWHTISLLGCALGPLGAVMAVVGAVILSSLVLALWVALLELFDRIEGFRKYARVVLVSAGATMIWVVSIILSAQTPDIVYKAF
jgi:alginate O-acetyltransferase complex protein AlgI